MELPANSTPKRKTLGMGRPLHSPWFRKSTTTTTTNAEALGFDDTKQKFDNDDDGYGISPLPALDFIGRRKGARVPGLRRSSGREHIVSAVATKPHTAVTDEEEDGDKDEKIDEKSDDKLDEKLDEQLEVKLDEKLDDKLEMQNDEAVEDKEEDGYQSDEDKKFMALVKHTEESLLTKKVDMTVTLDALDEIPYEPNTDLDLDAILADLSSFKKKKIEARTIPLRTYSKLPACSTSTTSNLQNSSYNKKAYSDNEEYQPYFEPIHSPKHSYEEAAKTFKPDKAELNILAEQNVNMEVQHGVLGDEENEQSPVEQKTSNAEDDDDEGTALVLTNPHLNNKNSSIVSDDSNDPFDLKKSNNNETDGCSKDLYGVEPETFVIGQSTIDRIIVRPFPNDQNLKAYSELDVVRQNQLKEIWVGRYFEYFEDFKILNNKLAKLYNMDHKHFSCSLCAHLGLSISKFPLDPFHSFASGPKFEQHWSRQHNSTVTCTICLEVFDNLQGLKYHMDRMKFKPNREHTAYNASDKKE